MDELIKAYSGGNAKKYDDRRAKSRRWRKETEIMVRLLKEIQPETVLDCPFGTGRWISTYELFCKNQVIGIDISADMLAQAQEKLKNTNYINDVIYDLRVGSIFELENETLKKSPDLVVCVRFINWIDLKAVRAAIKNLSYLEPDNFILGASVVPIDAGRLKRWWYKKSLDRVNRKSVDGRPQFVHEEAGLLEIMNENGWKLEKKCLVMRRSSRVNYLYHLTKVQVHEAI